MKTYDIVALGPSGSGKTVFLASMYHELYVQDPGRAFYITIDHPSRVRLNEIYNQVARPGANWPQGSFELREWVFTACVSSPFGNYPLSRFRYVDYPGVWLTDGNPPAGFIEQLEAADALLGVLDGSRILAMLRGEPDGDEFLSSDLHAMLSLMQQSTAPIQFVITKWDLVQRRYSLAEVRDRLLATRPFRNLVTARGREARIRLIPVSAVGSGFAEPRADGTMAKSGEGEPKPYFVDIPLASVIPDQLQYVIDSLDEKTRSVMTAKVDASKALTTPERWALMAGRALESFGPVLCQVVSVVDPKLGKRLSAQDLRELARTIDRRARAKLETNERQQLAERERSLQAVRDERSALDHLNESFALTLERFERQHPDSLLAAATTAIRS